MVDIGIQNIPFTTIFYQWLSILPSVTTGRTLNAASYVCKLPFQGEVSNIVE